MPELPWPEQFPDLLKPYAGSLGWNRQESESKGTHKCHMFTGTSASQQVLRLHLIFLSVCKLDDQLLFTLGFI